MSSLVKVGLRVDGNWCAYGECLPVVHLMCDPWQHVEHVIVRAFNGAMQSSVAEGRRTLRGDWLVDWQLTAA
eukprot:9513974-Alexandrium_andersonii.AAC.1